MNVTYRVQLRAEFGFSKVADLADYWARLGISHIYLSPILQSAPGSTHGYDVVDHSTLNQDLGGESAYAEMGAALSAAGLSQVVDIVPNHMAIGTLANRWWWDVLENGPASRFATFFDVDWGASGSRDDRILLPVLGDHFGRILESGELRIELRSGRFVGRYHENLFPAAPRSLGPILRDAKERCGADVLAFLGDALERTPQTYSTDRDGARRRHRDQVVLYQMFEDACADESIARAVEASIRVFNSDVERLETFFDAQNYRLAFWQSGRHELEYRRFFDIDTLVGLRMEDEEVFQATHAKTFQMVDAGHISGLRIDHVDGLRDPKRYLSMLHRRIPTAWVVVEKILERDERLPEGWPCAGTTGYDFLSLVNGLWINPEGLQSLHQAYRAFTEEAMDWEEVLTASKHRVLQDGLRADVDRLSSLLSLITEKHRRHRDHAPRTLRLLVETFLISFPVYRTYVTPAEASATLHDRATIESVAARVRAMVPELDDELVAWVQDMLLLRHRGELETEFAMRFQQVTSPVMAKGVEDTAMYRNHALLAANEVGSNPDHPTTSISTFHGAMMEASSRMPQTMLATSTHDTKRSEDVRARLAVLSEIPDEWGTQAAQWFELLVTQGSGEVDRPTVYAFLQTIVGAWPIDVERMTTYMFKLVREAKVHTSWTQNNTAYEERVASFVRDAFLESEFLTQVEAFVARIREAGWMNSLAQTLVKLTAPGIPDIYQGCELWDFSLVDPDNRRPVDYERRRQLLERVESERAEDAWERRAEGDPKFFVTFRTLQLRKTRPEAFGDQGSYQALPVLGADTEHVLAFSRGDAAVTIVPRWTLRRAPTAIQASVSLGNDTWRNVFTDELVSGDVQVANLFARFPVALLERSPNGKGAESE